jgi:hypothetical protein
VKIYALFMQRKEPYEGAYGPELLTAWDEFSADDNRVGFKEDCDRQLAMVGDEAESHAVVIIDIPLAEVMKVLRPDAVIQGTVLQEP